MLGGFGSWRIHVTLFLPPFSKHLESGWGLGGHRVAMDTATLGWYSIWWPFHHQAPTPHAHQSMSLNVAKCNLGKVKLETCWPAVYHVGCPTRSQGPLVAHVLAVPALSFSRMIAHQSLLLLLPPSPLGKYVPCCSPLVVQCDRYLVLGGHRVAMDTATLGWYSIWWPFHHQAPTPHAHQSMSLKSQCTVISQTDAFWCKKHRQSVLSSYLKLVDFP